MYRVSQAKSLLDKYIAGLCFNRTAISIQKIDSKSSKSHLKSLPRISPKSYRHNFQLKAFFNFAHKRPTFAFTSESGYTLGSLRKIAHNGSYGETGGSVLVTAWSILLPPHLGKEKSEEADARLWRVSASSGAAAPLGCVALVANSFTVCVFCP